MKIKLSQLEKSDLPHVGEFLNHGFKNFIDHYIEYNSNDLERWLNRIHNSNNEIIFAIRGSEDVYKDFLVGICSIRNIDWLARHGEIFFMMVDKDGNIATIHNRTASKAAFKLILDYAFKSLNLNKVWVEIFEHNKIKEVLEEFGFVAEGVRRATIFKLGKMIDSIIVSLTAPEYLD